jgi:hypothetical protein
MTWKDLTEDEKLDVKGWFVAGCICLALVTLGVWIAMHLVPAPSWQGILEWFTS